MTAQEQAASITATITQTTAEIKRTVVVEGAPAVVSPVTGDRFIPGVVHITWTQDDFDNTWGAFVYGKNPTTELGMSVFFHSSQEDFPDEGSIPEWLTAIAEQVRAPLEQHIGVPTDLPAPAKGN